MNRYFFNFRNGSEIARDRMGMYLPSLEAARAEALDTCRDLSMIASMDGETDMDCELQVADASGEPVFSIPVSASKH